MTKLWLGLAAGAAMACTAGNALADGMPQYGRAVVRDCANFHGFYIGVNGGWAEKTAYQNNLDGYRNNDTAGSFTATGSGGTAGGQVGFNLQRHCTVFGVEADWNWARVNAETDPFPGAITTGVNQQADVKNSVSSYGTLRTRSGIIVDHTLLYLTGGLAWADEKAKVDFVRLTGNSPGTEHFAWTENRVGWTAGVGIEHALGSNISIKSEVLYMGFGEDSHQVASTHCAGGSGFCRFSDSENVWVARVGLNYRFGGDREVGPLK